MLFKDCLRAAQTETVHTALVCLELTTGLLNAFVVGLVGSTLYSIMIMGNATAFPVLLWTNLLTRLGAKPLTIAVNVVLVTVVNRAVYKPVVSHILRRA